MPPDNRPFLVQIKEVIRKYAPQDGPLAQRGLLSLQKIKQHVAEMRGGDTYVDPRFDQSLRTALRRGCETTGDLARSGNSYRAVKTPDEIKREEKVTLKAENAKYHAIRSAARVSAPAWMRSALLGGHFNHTQYGYCRVLELDAATGLIKKFCTNDGLNTVQVSAKGNTRSVKIARAS